METIQEIHHESNSKAGCKDKHQTIKIKLHIKDTILMTTLFIIFSIVLVCIIISVIYFIWLIMKSSSATWIKITTFFIGIIIILSIIGMLMRFLMIIIFQNSIEQDDTKAIDMDSPIFEEELIPITEEDMKSIPEDTIKFR